MTSEHLASFPQPALIDSDGSDSGQSASPQSIRNTSAAPSDPRQIRRSGSHQRADAARLEAQEAKLNELQQQLAQLTSLLQHLQPDSSTFSSQKDSCHSSNGDADESNSEPSDSAAEDDAPPLCKNEDVSPTAARPPSQGHRQRPHDPSTTTQSVTTTGAPPALRPPSARPQPAERARRKSASASYSAAPERLVKADLHRLSTSLEPSKIQRWVEELLQTFEDYSPDASWLLSLPAPAARSALDEYAFLRPLDRWAARQAINTFVLDAPYVQLLMSDATPAAVAARTSGVALLEYVRAKAAAMSSESAKRRIAQFDAKTYFKQSMDNAATQIAASELRSDFNTLPAERTLAPHGLIRALLAKLPASIAAQVATLEDKLVEAEAMGQPPPWTFDQLVYVSSQHMLVAARRTASASAAGAQVNAMEVKGRKDPTAARTGPVKCPCCGKQGHLPRDCPTTCSECKQRSCPGNYGSPCAVNAATMPDPIMNAFGKPIPPNIKAFLFKARQNKKGAPSTSGQKTTVKQTNAVEAMPLSEENAHIWEIMDDAGKSANVLLAARVSDESSTSDGRMREACPTFKSTDGTIVRATPRMIMLDGGSNINLFNHSDVPRLGLPVPSAPVQVSGWSDAEAHSVLSSYQVDLQIEFSNGTTKRVTTQVAHSDQARRDILSESTMWDEHLWSVRKEPDMRIDTPFGPIPLLRINGVYFVEALVLPPRPNPMPTRAETNALSAKRDGALHLSRLWAARLHAGSAALRRQLPACSGMGVEVLTPAMAKVADQDVLNKRSNTRRQVAQRSSSAPTKPGELFILDAFGPVAAQSVLDGSHYELEATQWISFIGGIIAHERSLGHVVTRLRFDRAPNLHAESFQQAVHLQFQVAVEFAGRHEGVGAVEQRNDHKQRIAEADLMRAERTQSYLLPARIYAGWRINRRVAEGSTKTRLELHTGQRPNFSDPIPYLFGIACSVLEDESERGPKGAGCSSDSLHKGRTSAGVFVGIVGRSYKVRLDRGVTVERRHITPHDEHVLLLRGVPSSAVSVDASTGTDDLSSTSGHQPQLRSSSSHESLREPPSSRTRSKRAVDATVSLIEAHLEAAPLATISESFDDALFQFRPDVYELCASLPLDDARLLLSRSPPSPADKLRECCKATADVVQVQTDIGIQEYRVPATHLARERAPDALEWRRADEAALQVLLNTQSRDGRRNVLVPVSKPASLGQPLIPSVLQRRIKTDPVTKKLIKRKSRLCASGDRQKLIQQNAGTYVPRQAHADAADDLLIKSILAVSARTSKGPSMRRVKLDIGNAYSRGIRVRPPAYMSLGKSLARVSDAGEELCLLELHTPTYGEEPSGDEWGATFHADITRIGWQPAEAVPALYYFLLPDVEARAYFIRVVDDVLLVFPRQCQSAAENTIACFKEFYHGDVSVEWDPTSFVGYAILDDPETGAVTLNMASHVEHAVRQYLPGLLQTPPVRPSATLPKGQSFQSLADSLRHQPATKPLDERQTRVQRMVGAMRYPEKVLPVLTLGLHRLSCVAQNPPPAATLVADLLLEIAYDHRYEGLTYGGSVVEPEALRVVSAYGVDESERPSEELVGYGDATWTAGIHQCEEQLPPLATLGPNGCEVASRDLYSVVLTFRGAAILHQTKKLALLVDCSMAAEEVATSKAAEYVEYASQVMRALGTASDGPVTIGTDNASNRQVAMRQGASARSKHLLRRYFVLMQRVQAGEVRVVHVKDDANPADFLTKWVPARKLRSSVAYVSGQRARRKGFVQQTIMQRRAPSGVAPSHA